MTRNKLKNLLHDVWIKSSTDFSGIGIIVYSNAAHLPIISLRDTAPDISGTLTEALSRLSSKKSKYHDGFHLLNKNLELTHTAQYFSPPIIREALYDKSRLVGGRFVAALFGSAIPGVIAIGIVSEGKILSIFENGREVYTEELR